MARFTTDRLALLAVMMATFVLVAIAPACAMPECMGVDQGMGMAMDMDCAPYMMVDDSPDGVVYADVPAPVAVVTLAPAPLPIVELPVVLALPESGPSPPLPPLGVRLSV
ncbi:MAG: hypothetical protein PF636_01150 [Actinomycetota bacterium]|jgi:hypothetical protein|nr:hypothetical protein [Actinomycetota bacterium]